MSPTHRVEPVRYVLDGTGRRRYKCPRCGMVRGWFRDEDFLELWHERAELEGEVKTLRRDLARLSQAEELARGG